MGRVVKPCSQLLLNKWCSACLFQLLPYKQVFGPWSYSVPWFSHSCDPRFNMTPTIWGSAVCILRAKRLWYALWRKCMLGKLCSGMNHGTVTHEFHVSDSTIYRKVSLNRDIHKSRLHVHWLTKILWPEAQQEPNPMCLQEWCFSTQ